MNIIVTLLAFVFLLSVALIFMAVALCIGLLLFYLPFTPLIAIVVIFILVLILFDKNKKDRMRWKF